MIPGCTHRITNVQPVSVPVTLRARAVGIKARRMPRAALPPLHTLIHVDPALSLTESLASALRQHILLVEVVFACSR